MSELLRAFRLGTVNLFGIAIPGFLLLFFATFGLLIPALTFLLHNNGTNWLLTIEWYNATKWFMIGTFILFSYVVGFILRLTSPDKLDGISIKASKSALCHKDDNDDCFPYLRLGTYLSQRGHADLQEFIPWNTSNCTDDAMRAEEAKKCSNTAINRLKVEISFKCPELASTVESNEAHIRLMSGTWLAIRTTLPLVGLGALICLYVSIPFFRSSMDPTFTKCLVYYQLQLLSNIFLIAGMMWSNKRIEQLFHPRRVGELLFILQAVFLARQFLDNSQKNSVGGKAGHIGVRARQDI